jgi:23S rRNA pseudouridine1911/1915/1917 synthase
VHAKELGMPVVGDPTYGGRLDLPKHFDPGIRNKAAKLSRQMLHARKLGIDHPVTGERLLFSADVPDDFRELLDVLAKYRTQ